jgi:hypothetical protein
MFNEQQSRMLLDAAEGLLTVKLTDKMNTHYVAQEECRDQF